MSHDDRPVGDYEPERPSGPRRAVRLLLFLVCVTVLLASLGLLAASGWFLLDLERNPRQPPGNIVGIIPAFGLMGGAGGLVLSALGLFGLWVTRLRDD